MKKKILVLIAMAILAGAAHADWIRIEHGETSVSLYIDQDSRLPSGRGSIVMWHLVDYATAQDYEGKPFRSIKGQNEYDCGQGTRRDLLHLWHQEAMGNSHMVQAAYVPGPWTAPAEGSIEHTLLRVACLKK